MVLVLVLGTGLPAVSVTVRAAWQPAPPREPQAGEIPVTAPGNCDQAGAAYILVRDIAAPASALFLGQDVTLDLNGHTLTYAADYANVPNCGVEDERGRSVECAYRFGQKVRPCCPERERGPKPAGTWCKSKRPTQAPTPSGPTASSVP